MTSLLALHGFTGRPDDWDFLNQSALAFSAPALVGHAGANEHGEVSTFEREVDRLAQLAPPGEAVHVIGYSLGARLALGIALRHPERVARLTLISGHPGLATEDERRARRAADSLWVERLLAQGLLAFVDAWEEQPLWATQAALTEATRAGRRAARLSHEAAGLARSLRVTGLGEMPSYGDRLSELNVPTNLLAGELDPKFSSLAYWMAERLRHATVDIVPGAGHDLLLERPEFVRQVIRRANHTGP
jgi:2-succinyl-6-hydroxy-2,4-cyclohexadiene-1-carboxylate synthase